MRKFFFITIASGLFLLSGKTVSFGQVASTIASGNWDNPAIWSGGAVPTSSFGVITVRHTIHVRSSIYPSATPLIIDQTTVGANGFTGYLIIDAGAYVQLNNGVGNDLTLAGVPTIGKLDISGRLIASTGIVVIGNTAANLNFLAAATYEHRQTSTATALPTATYNATSTVLINGFAAGGNIASASWSVPLGNVIFDCPGLGANTVDFGGHLSNILGDLTIQNSGTTGIFVLKSTAASTGSATMTIAGNLNVTGVSRFFLCTTAAGIQVNIAKDFNFNPGATAGTSQNTTTGSSTLQVSGKISMLSRTWNFASGNNGVGTIDLKGSDFNNTGGTILTTTGGGAANGNMNATSSTTSQNINIDPTAIGAGTINAAINNTFSTPTVKVLRNLTLSALNLQSGKLDINGQSLTVNGVVTQTAGSIDATTASTLIFGGAGAFPAAALNIVSTASFLDFRLNRPGQTLRASANFKVTTLDLFAGTFNNTINTPQMVSGGVVNRQATTAANTGVLQNALSAVSTYSVNYTNNVALTTGAELPAVAAVLQNLTKAGTNTLTVNQSVTINGDLTVSAGTFILANTRSISLVGNYTNNAVSNLGNAASTFTFASGNATTANFSGTTAPSFNGAIIFSDNVNATVGFSLFGNMTVGAGATVNAVAGTVSLAGTTAVTNGGTLNLNAITILATSTLTAPTGTMGIAGNFTFTNATSAFNNNAGTILFNGTTNLLGTGTKTFRNIAVANSKSLISAVALTINGNLTNDGTVSFTAGILTYGGATTVSGSGINSFTAVTINTASTVTANSGFSAGGALTLNGTAALAANANITVTGAVALNGTSTITASGNVSMGAAFTVAGTYSSSATTIFTGATTMTGAGSKIMKDVSITGSLTPNTAYTITGNLGLGGTGTLNAGNNTTTFGGVTILSNGGTGTVTFNNVTINSGNSILANANIVISGANFTGTGNYSSTAITTFSRAGTTTLTGTGSKSFGTVTINTGTTLTPNAAFTVNGNLAVNGTGVLTAGNNTASFGGATAITTNGAPTISFNNLTINAAASLTAFPGTMTVNGNFTNNGAFAHNNGRVTFNGATTKNITSATPASITGFYHITVNNGAATPDVSVEAGVDLFGVLTLAANAVVDADGVGNNRIFTVRSTSDSPTLDAAIATLPAGAIVTGNVTVQRYMAIGGASNRIYRYISSPVLNPPASDLQNEIPITGTFTGASSCTGCRNKQSMFWYDETVITGGINGGYTNFPLATNTETMVAGRGYAIFVRGNIDPVLSAGNARFDLSGPINSGAINYNASYTSSGVPADDGWNLVGNPYPSTIDWNAAAGWTKTNIGASIYITDNVSNPTRFATWNGVVGTNGGSRYIAMGQGFFVQTSAAAPVLTSNESVKAGGTQTTYFRSVAPTNLLRIALTQAGMQDEAVIHFRDSATADFDYGFDAVKLKNLKNGATPFLNLSTMSQDSKLLAINSMPALGCSNNIPLDVSDVPQGTYQLNFSNLESFSSYGTMALTDNFTSPKSTIDIRQQASYSFQVTTDPLSFGSARFQLTFSNQLIPNQLSLKATDVCQGTAASIVVNSTQPGVLYFATRNGNPIGQTATGTGSTMTLPILQDNLKIGINTFEVWAQPPYCTAASTSQTISLTVDSVYETKKIATVEACQVGAVKLTAAGAPLGGHYNWYTNQNDTVPIGGEAAETLVTPFLKKTTPYYVAVVNTLGCEGARVEMMATVVKYVDPEITEPADNTLQSNFSTGNHWYLDEQLLPDTTASLKIRSSGLYRLEVKIQQCTASVERQSSVSTITAVEEEIITIKAYPNPVAGVITIEIPDPKNQIIEAPIFNTLGTQVGTIQLGPSGKTKRGQFDFTSLPQGFYYILVGTGNDSKVLKVIRK